MVELFEQNIQTIDRQSSKGNQLKWKSDGFWYKADYAGYEGFSEYVASQLLLHSTLDPEEFVRYEPVEIRYNNQIFKGAKSRDFLKAGQQIFTIERLFANQYAKSLYQSVFHIENHKERLRFLVDSIERITGLTEFGVYMNKVLTLDAVILNEDRHSHNIAVIANPDGTYDYCPIFDNGAGLLSDTTLDYPMDGDVYDLISSVEAKTICRDFDEAVDISEELYGSHLEFQISNRQIEKMLTADMIYDESVKKRVERVIRDRIRKYQYLFKR